MNINEFLLMAPQGSAAGGGSMQTVIMLVLMVGVFYFFMIRPQLKKQKEAKSFRESLKAGDAIVTVGGIHGKINAVNDTTVIIKVESGNTLKIEKSALVRDFDQHQQQKR